MCSYWYGLSNCLQDSSLNKHRKKGQIGDTFCNAVMNFHFRVTSVVLISKEIVRCSAYGSTGRGSALDVAHLIHLSCFNFLYKSASFVQTLC